MPEVLLKQPEASHGATRTLRRLTLLLLAVGIVWRLVRYATNQPIWGDEASLDINLMNRGLADLLHPLDYGQVAPPLFLLLEWLMQHGLGNAEWVLRLLPLAAGIAAALLFWRWSRLLLSPLGAVFATGFYAVGFYSVRFSVELKPYAFDQVAAMGLLFTATLWMKQPSRLGAGLGFASLLPVVIFGSYPSVFVAGGALLAVFLALRGVRARGPWVTWVGAGALMVGCFLLLLQFVAGGQYQHTQATMDSYWADGFPPRDLLRLPLWLWNVHAGDMFAYPQGGKNGGSVATLALALVGVGLMVRQRRGALLVLLLAPFCLTMIAAAMHRYPYGGGPRVAQHLAPAICLLSGSGAAAVIGWLRVDNHRRAATGAAVAALAIFGLAGAIYDIGRPYKSTNDLAVRAWVSQAFKDAGDRTPIYVLQAMPKVPVNFQCYIRWQKRAVVWDASSAARWQVGGEPSLVVMNFDSQLDGAGMPPRTPGVAWSLVHQDVRRPQLGPIERGPAYFQLLKWKSIPSSL